MKQMVAVTAMAVLCLTGCRSSRSSTEISQAEVDLTALSRLAEARRDSATHRLLVAELEPVPADRASLEVSRDALDSIPQGHALSRREGRATAAIARSPDGGALVVTATCDSLSRQLLLYEEAYALLSDRYEQLSDSLRTTFEARTEEERKRTKPPEWNWIAAAFLAGILTGCAAVSKRKR